MEGRWGSVRPNPPSAILASGAVGLTLPPRCPAAGPPAVEKPQRPVEGRRGRPFGFGPTLQVPAGVNGAQVAQKLSAQAWTGPTTRQARFPLFLKALCGRLSLGGG